MKTKNDWMEVIKNYLKLLELEERVVVDRNDWRRIHVGSSINFLCLGSYSQPQIIGIKAGWFGLVIVSKATLSNCF